MKAAVLNLGVNKKSQIRQSNLLPLLLGLAAAAFTLMNLYNLVSEIRVKKTYETRIAELQKARDQKPQKHSPPKLSQEQMQVIEQDHQFLSDLVKNSQVPLTAQIDTIERAKPSKLLLQEISFSEALNNITIKGNSKFPDAVSSFLIGLENTKRFKVTLTKGEISRNKLISFELKTLWMPDDL